MARFAPLPSTAAWHLHDAHEGFEVVRLEPSDQGGFRFSGTSVGVEDGVPWSFRYLVEVDDSWHGVRARVVSDHGRELTVESAGPGEWVINGVPDPALTGCVDIDLEGSALTNTAPIHRLDLDVGGVGDSPAVYLRSTGAVERLDQTYQRLATASGFAFDYASPRFGYQATLAFADDGLVTDYPGIARRVDVRSSAR